MNNKTTPKQHITSIVRCWQEGLITNEQFQAAKEAIEPQVQADVLKDQFKNNDKLS